MTSCSHLTLRPTVCEPMANDLQPQRTDDVIEYVVRHLPEVLRALAVRT